jgi:hypothetical protein
LSFTPDTSKRVIIHPTLSRNHCQAACSLTLEAFTRCASWSGNSAHHGVTHIATSRIIANVQGNARGKMWTLVYTYWYYY